MRLMPRRRLLALDLRSPIIIGSLAVTVMLTILLIWRGWLQDILSTQRLEPHGTCYFWLPGLIVLHLSSDSFIALAYISISLTLVYFVYKTRRDLPFSWIFIAFGTFIIACGCTHIFEVITLWVPVYWLSGTIKLITAIASVSTAVVLPPLIPKVRTLLNAAKVSEERKQQLEDAHKELEHLYEKSKELDQLKTDFIANVSHELRTPVTLLLGSIKELLNHQVSYDVKVMERNALTLLKHVNDLLDISKLEAGRMEIEYTAVDIVQLLQVSLAHFETIARQKQITISSSFPESLIVLIDAAKIEHVLLNLLSNACKFTPASGQVFCSLTTTSEQFTVIVQDTGPGVRKELQEQIFERFRQGDSATTRTHGGTGLGLTIARELVALHKGTITVDDAPGGGARFTLNIPLNIPANTPALTAVKPPFKEHGLADFIEDEQEEPLPETRKDPSQPLILIIEDNRDMAHYIARTLATRYAIAVAFDGPSGIAKARALKPDLILSDVMLPALSGDQLLKQLRADTELEMIPLIVLSARSDEMLRVQVLRNGAQDYLVKPFSAEELQARIENLLVMGRVRQVLQQELSERRRDVLEMVQEVSRRKHELEATLDHLHLSETRFQRLFQADLLAIALWRPNGVFMEANNTFVRMLGYNHDQITGGDIRWNDVVPEEYRELARQKAAEMVRNGVCTPFECAFQNKDGHLIPVLIGGVILEPECWAGYILDISERKALELQKAHLLEREQEANEQLRETNKMQNDFIATVSHEFRTTLTGIQGFSELLRDQELATEEIKEYASDIHNDARRLNRMITQLLDLERMKSSQSELQIEQVQLNQVLTEVAARFHVASTNHIIRLQLDEAVPPIEGDSDKLTQVCTNLLSNAMKYSPAGGEILVSSQFEQDQVHIQICDHGIGIAPEALAQIFAPYSRVNSEKTRYIQGTGLGLSIVKQIIQMHHGRVWAESTLGQGSQFHIVLPLTHHQERRLDAATTATTDE